MPKNNILLKAIALVVAILLWAIIFASEARTIKLPFAVDLQIRGLEDTLVASVSPEQSRVYLTVVAEHNQWQKLTASDFSVYIDLAGKKEGNYSATVQYLAENPSVTITDVSVRSVNVSIEPASSKEVSLTYKIIGTPAEGLVVRSVSFEPQKVTAKAPKSVIDKLYTAEAQITLSGESSVLNKNVKLIGLDIQNKELLGIVFEPQEVSAQIEIGQSGLGKILTIKPKFASNVRAGFWVSNYSVTPPYLDAILKEDLPSGAFLETREINLSALTASGEVEVELNIPAGVTLIDDIKKVKVKIELSPILSNKEVSLGLRFNGLTNLKVATITPNQVTALLSGSASALEQLSANNSYINFAMDNYKTPGNYAFDINASMIQLPDGVSLIATVPSAVSINLENK